MATTTRHVIRQASRSRGRGLDGGTFTLAGPCRSVKIRSLIDRADKTDGNSYAVSLYRSSDGGATWQPIVTDARHDTLGDYKGDAEKGEKTGERSVCLQVEFGGVPLPAGTMLRVTYDSPNEMRVGIELEVD